MPDFIDVRLRVRKERLGDLIFVLPTFVQPLGLDVIREPVIKALEPPKPSKGAKLVKHKGNGKGKGPFTPAQTRVLNAIQKGAVDTASIMAHTKSHDSRGYMRPLNRLLKAGVITGKNGSYQVV